MAKLSGEDRNRLQAILVSLPDLQTQSDRYQMLKLADLDAVIPQINLEGSAMMAISRIVVGLESYGRLTYAHEALGLFLNRVKELMGPSDPKTAFIEEILSKYDLMTPSKTPPAVNEWKGETSPQKALEKIIGENTLRHISFLEQGLEVSRSVAFIDFTEWTGTGFMVSANLLLTNNHVIPNAKMLAHTRFKFNYQLKFDGREQKLQTYRARESGVFNTNSELDYTLVELEGAPGQIWGVAPLSSALPKMNSRVSIIQHPAGLPKQISFQNNLVEYADSTIVQYLTSTLPGSSGSPVFNDKWEVVAVHHAGGDLLEPQTNRMFFRNEGISIRAILNNLPAELQANFPSQGA